MDYPKRLTELGCRPGSEAPDRDVQTIEASIGVRLPAKYRAFLLECGGWWGDILCPCREPTPFGDTHWISGFHDARDVRALLDSTITPRNMVSIATGNFAKYTCVSVAGIDH